MSKTLFLCRGLPGSGKSTLAKLLTDYICEADDYFMHDGEYKFDAMKLGQAHTYCQEKVRGYMQANRYLIVVSNTFTTNKEMKPYLELCEQYGYTPFVIHCENQFGNVHNVPEEALVRMRARWQPRN